MFKCERHRDCSGRAAKIADEPEHVLFVIKVLNDAERPGWFVAVVGGDKFELSAGDPARSVGLGEGCFDAEFQLPARFTIGADEGRSHSKPDLLVADAMNYRFGRGGLPR